jgi:hypothetical protein
MPGYNQKGHGPPSPIMKAFSRNDSPPQVAEAISQSDPNTLGSTPRESSNQNPFHKGQVAWLDNLPPVALTPSLKNSKSSAPTKIPLA